MRKVALMLFLAKIWPFKQFGRQNDPRAVMCRLSHQNIDGSYVGFERAAKGKLKSCDGYHGLKNSLNHRCAQFGQTHALFTGRHNQIGMGSGALTHFGFGCRSDC